MINDLNIVKEYILNNYKIDSIIKECFTYKYKLIIKHKKYDLEIHITDATDDNYLNDKKGIGFNYQANKRYNSELNYHGGGYLVEYKNFDEIDKFLSNFGYKKEKQISIFDLI